MTPGAQQTITVVGASLAGMRAAETLRRHGFDGRITIVGAERHWPPYDRPPLSKELLAGTWDDLDKARLRTELDAGDRNLDLRLGRRAIAASATERTITLDDDSTVEWDGLVVATGATPRTLPGVQETRGVHVLRTVDDLVALRADLDGPAYVAVVGAGFIGCEVAASCRTLGHPVSLVEALPAPLANVLGEEAGDSVAALHRDHGVDLHLGQPVAGLEGTQRVDGVRLVDGTLVRADTVVVGIGVTPNTGWLEGSGLVLDDGVVCDATLAAAGTEYVVAAGDVARWPHPLYDGDLLRAEHWTNAAEQGEHAARTLLALLGHGDAEPAPFAAVPYFWSDQYGTRLQLVGTTARHDRTERPEEGVVVYLRDGRVIGALCIDRRSRTIPWRRAIEARALWPVAP
jgi:NADPH-dependent 2,4-dienoyl-CoA reductase/sulfur reductase-like enzyme